MVGATSLFVDNGRQRWTIHIIAGNMSCYGIVVEYALYVGDVYLTRCTSELHVDHIKYIYKHIIL